MTDSEPPRAAEFMGMPGVIENGQFYLRRIHEYIDGRHYTAYVGDVMAMKREGRLDEAAQVLLRIIGCIERPDRGAIAPWYYVSPNTQKRPRPNT